MTPLFYILGYPNGLPNESHDPSSTRWLYTSPPPAFALDDIVQGPPVEPTLEALQSYMSDLEREVRNFDFRLQYLYHSRTSTLNLLAEAKRQADKLKK